MATTAIHRQVHPTSPPSSGHRYLPWLRPLREERNWSLEELGQLAGVAESTIRRIERGYSAQLCTVHRLARAFGVPTQVLSAPASLLTFSGNG